MENLLLYLLKSAALISIFLLVYQLLLRNDTSFQANRHFLLGGIFAAGVLPAIKFTRIVEIPFTGSGPAFPAAAGTPILPEASIEMNWWEVAGGIYAAIAAVMLIRFLFQLLSLFRVFRGGSLTREGSYRIIKTSQEVSPFSFFRYIVLNPQLHAEEDLRNILEHEKTHASQWHSVDVLLANLTTALLWFNPLSWWYRKSLVQNLEYIADRETIASVPRNEYQHTLVKLVVANHQPVLANNFYQSLIKKRIIMLNKTSKQKPSLWKFGTIVPLLFAFMFFFNVKTKAQVVHSTGDITEISAVIDPETTDEELKSFKSIFAEEDVELGFENLKRSSDGDITNLEVHFRNRKIQGEKGYFKVNDPHAIKSFAIVTKDGLTAFNDDPEKVNLETNSKPPFATFKKETSFSATSTGASEAKARDTSGKTPDAEDINASLDPNKGIRIRTEQTPDPVIVLNGKVLSKNFDLNTINPEEIANINILKGKSAEALYGTEAGERGAILIVTKVFAANSDKQVGFTADKVIINKVGDDSSSVKGIGVSDVPFVEDDILYILNGKVMEKDFNSKSIDPNTIESINVLKGEMATEKYGTKAKKGVIEIRTKG